MRIWHGVRQIDCRAIIREGEESEVFLNLETRMSLAAGCCYSEVGKEERNLLGEVLTAEDTCQGENRFAVGEERCGRGEANADKELSAAGPRRVHLCELQAGPGAESSMGVPVGEALPDVGMGRRKQEGHCCPRVLFWLRRDKADETALSFLFRL